MKYSIVIPVYNVEKYIERCLNSVLNQTYKNLEVIVVNDGTPDNSQAIIDKFAERDKRVKSYIKENGGLSSARNYGVNYATGDYLLFIDSDDYIGLDYIEKVNKALTTNDADVLKSKLVLVDDDGTIIRRETGLNTNGYVSFIDLVNIEFLEPAWSYVYKLDFYKKNNFMYVEGMLHEDFGLTPEILMKANKIYYLNHYTYYYVQRNNSIMSTNSLEKLKTKAYDMLQQYDRLIKIDYDADPKKIAYYKSFLANALILKARTLSGNDKKEYKKELKKRKVLDDILTNSLKRKIKKIILKIKFMGC